jgi:formylglycine-generating enzyme required for sulfatase activity
MLVGAGVGWWKQGWLREQYEWRIAMRPSVMTAEQERALAPGQEFRECAHGCPTMVVVPPGSFVMGSPEDDAFRDDDEAQHNVMIGKSFAVGNCAVTFAEWDACVDAGACLRASDGGWGRGDRPAINVSWDDVQIYVAWLKRVTGKEYRLLAESEWEYAARAGTSTAYFWGDDEGTGNANCSTSGSRWDLKQTAPVGSFKPNAFHLYDMQGNVWQWVKDVYRSGYGRTKRRQRLD